MRLHFEIWIKDQGISSRTEELIDEAIICYRAKAYKASLLFSYLSFQNIIKERILSADAPPGYTPVFWSSIQGELRDDDKWESKVIECIERNKPGSIFRLSDDVKNQYFYWKDRRNDCAHAKGNKIGMSHVETFWLFVESNLSKFGVNGGKESLLERIRVFFDPNLTPHNDDPLPIIKDIPYALELSDYNEVLETIYDSTNIVPGVIYNEDFWLQLLTLEGEFRDHLVNFLKTKKKLNLVILEKDPSLINNFSSDPVFIRSIWKELLSNSYLHYKIAIALLRHALIPKEQLKEFVETISKINDSLFINQYHETDFMTLEDSGFFSEYKLLAFKERKISNFDWARENRHLICHFISRSGLDEDSVNAINLAFSGTFTPWKLGDSLEELFKNKPSLKTDYKRINEEIGGVLPDRFFPKEE
ncbi:hypothetical protein ACWF7H_14040 [Peribacillus butanolivorans]|uniref:hypothetical protein n=1 Tax=Peribacillus butanolivorans TaxID=421767 RepID=UPI0036C6E3BF